MRESLTDLTQLRDLSARLRGPSDLRLSLDEALVGLGLCSWDPATNELIWDSTLKAMWGLPADAELDWDTWRAAVHPDDLGKVDAAIARCTDPRGDGIYNLEYRVVGIADGVERWIATRGQTEFKDGRPIAFQGVALDITKQKLTEHSLEHLVDVRTRELAEVNASLSAEMQKRHDMSVRLESSFDAAEQLSVLSPRERQVLECLVLGDAHKMIAHRLGISVRTVELHRARMLQRLGTPHLADAIRLVVLAEMTRETADAAAVP